jgi:hypothetical protein
VNKIIFPSFFALALVACTAGTSAPTSTTTSTPTTTAEKSLESKKLVEVRLVDTIDEDRGYCLDIAGGKGANAPLDKGMQAHTCYDYTGGLLEDQSFDSALLKKGEFKITYFDVCITASAIEIGASIELASCENKDTQQFSLEENGNLIVKSKPELCVTVNATEKREGRGATPVHVMRPLSLQACSSAKAKYQAWSLFSL